MDELKTTRRKTLPGVLFILAVLFATVAAITVRIISSRLRASSYEHYQLLADNTAETINAWLSGKKEIIENQRTFLEMTDDYTASYLTDFLERSVIERKDFDEICDIYFIDTEGGLTTANEFFTDFDLRTRAYYQDVLNTREIYYTSPYRDVSTGSFVMTMSVSCRHGDGSLAGVLAIDLYINAFLEITDSSLVPDNSYLFLVDSYYGMASHPYEAFGYVDDVPQSLSELQDGLYADLEQIIKEEEIRVVEMTDFDGASRSLFVSRIDPCSWHVIAAISDDVLKHSERLLIWYTVIALFLILCMGVLWTFFGTSSMMKQIRTAMEEAEAANRSKSDFLANMSHEIRTPINAVLGMNEMILRESRDADIRGYAEDVDSAGKNLLSIINDILDFSKIESGKLEIVKTDYRLSAVLNDVSNMIVFRAQDKGLSFDVFVDESLPDGLHGDEVRVRQIITNLLNNAVKYTEKGGVKLTVEETYVAGKDNAIDLVIMVEDTGMGIREEDMGRLFGKFERMDLEKNKTVEGTGLGLAITKNLVEMMGGTIRADSVYGEGSLFTVRLPQTVVSKEPIGDFRETFRKTLHEKDTQRKTFRAPDACILVVDDTEMNLTVMRGLLKETGLQITTATSGAEALSLTAETVFDLILMDQRMPGMDGVEALARIRAQENGSNNETPAICLTADAVQGARDRYLAEGFTDYLSKPVESAALDAMLIHHLPKEKVTQIVVEKQQSRSPEEEPARSPEEEPEREMQKIRTAEEAIRFEKEMTPKLLASYRALRDALKPYFEEEANTSDAERKELSPEELEEFYESVSELAGIYDQDGISRLFSQIEGYAVPEAERERFVNVKKCVRDSDWSGLQKAIKNNN